MEDILIQSDDRFILYPIKYKDLWDLFKQHEASFWTTEEIDLSEDKKDFDKLDTNEQFFIKKVLAFFACSDGLVMENLALRFLGEVQIAEARSFYSFQIAMENIHAETYTQLILALITEELERSVLFDSINNDNTIRKKGEWAIKWINNGAPFQQRLVAFACIEGIFFSGSFCSIFWLKKRGLMPGLTFSNELISRDEGLHTKFACSLYKYLTPLDKDVVCEIVAESVELEHEFVSSALPVDLIGIKSSSMKDYVCFVADVLLQNLGYEKMYSKDNPFDWMELISLQGKTNFFEKRVGEYQLAHIGTSGGRTFTLNEDF